jgi:hypothetical protein
MRLIAMLIEEVEGLQRKVADLKAAEAAPADETLVWGAHIDDRIARAGERFREAMQDEIVAAVAAEAARPGGARDLLGPSLLTSPPPPTDLEGQLTFAAAWPLLSPAQRYAFVQGGPWPLDALPLLPNEADAEMLARAKATISRPVPGRPKAQAEREADRIQAANLAAGTTGGICPACDGEGEVEPFAREGYVRCGICDGEGSVDDLAEAHRRMDDAV